MEKQRGGLFLAASFMLLLLSLPALTGGETGAGRFFLMGDGKIHIRNAKTGKEAKASLLNPDGTLNEKGFTMIDRVFGFPTKELNEHISPRLIFMLDYFSDIVAPGRMINLKSGYRSPEYNSKLRDGGGNVARTSTHIDGMALDFTIEGVDGKKIWDLIKEKECCGAGHYGGDTVHLDAARPRFWEAGTSKVRTGESDYNRRIHLSSDFDRYGTGDGMRLSFSAVSDFGFGIRRTVAFVADPEGDHPVATAEIEHRDSPDCLMIKDRKASRFIRLSLPRDLPPGRYRVRVEFCSRPFEEMPLYTASNEFEITGRRK